MLSYFPQFQNDFYFEYKIIEQNNEYNIYKYFVNKKIYEQNKSKLSQYYQFFYFSQKKFRTNSKIE